MYKTGFFIAAIILAVIFYDVYEAGRPNGVTITQALRALDRWQPLSFLVVALFCAYLLWHLYGK